MRIMVKSAVDIGRAVRERRTSQRITQEHLALVSGTGRRFVSDLERGKAGMRLASLLAVLDALGLRLEISTGPDDDLGRRDGA
jgi:HTH-type transcriptional regulator / antitoxin HipB